MCRQMLSCIFQSTRMLGHGNQSNPTSRLQISSGTLQSASILGRASKHLQLGRSSNNDLTIRLQIISCIFYSTCTLGLAARAVSRAACRSPAAHCRAQSDLTSRLQITGCMKGTWQPVNLVICSAQHVHGIEHLLRQLAR